MMKPVREPTKFELLSRVALVKCRDYDPQRVEKAVRQSVELLGGLRMFIKPDTSVLVKPNLLMSADPMTAIVTHPEVVRAVIKMLKELKCRIIVGDGPSVWGRYIEDVDTVYKMSGIEKVCKQEQVELVKFDARRWRGKFPLSTWVDSCDHVVNLPKFKTHDLTILTGAVKNLFGLVSGTFKTELHKMFYEKKEFSRILIDIYLLVKPSLTIVDGILALEGDGPATRGIPKELGIVLAGAECAALDTVMAHIMGIDPLEVPTIKEARRRGIGYTEKDSIEIVGERLEDAAKQPFLLPSTSLKKNIPAWLVTMAAQFIRYRPGVEHERCTRCGACVEACPVKVISLGDDERIHIRYRKCIACFCCQEACPSSAIYVKKSVFARMIGL